MVSLWMEQFSYMAIASVDEELCIDMIKMIDSCEKVIQKTDGIVAA